MNNFAYHRFLASDKTLKSMSFVESSSTKEPDIAICILIAGLPAADCGDSLWRHLGGAGLVRLLDLGPQGDLGAYHVDSVCYLPASADAEEAERQGHGLVHCHRRPGGAVHLHRRQYPAAGPPFLRLRRDADEFQRYFGGSGHIPADRPVPSYRHQGGVLFHQALLAGVPGGRVGSAAGVVVDLRRYRQHPGGHFGHQLPVEHQGTV